VAIKDNAISLQDASVQTEDDPVCAIVEAQQVLSEVRQAVKVMEKDNPEKLAT
jgi:hypothetical protein